MYEQMKRRGRDFENHVTKEIVFFYKESLVIHCIFTA